MTYNNAIPQAGDLLSVSQGQILTNFSQLYTVFAQDHIELDDGTVTDRGKHKQVTLKELAVKPGTTSTEMALYTKAVSGTTRLFYETPGGSEIQMTGPRTAAQNGVCHLAAGFKLVWGRDTVTSGGSTKAVTFSSAFSGVPYSVVTNEYAPTQTGATARSSGPAQASITASGFTYTVWGGVVPANVEFGYIAIGPA